MPLTSLSRAGGEKKPRQFISGEEVEWAASSTYWNSCKFVNATLGHLTVPVGDNAARIEAIRHTSHSLGGLDLPSTLRLKGIQRIDTVSCAYENALAQLEGDRWDGVTIACGLTDVEVMKSGAYSPRGGTFPHQWTMVVCRDGVWMFQGYGARGYTLLQYMERHQKKGDFPMSHEAARAWLADLERFMNESVRSGGRWTDTANELYLRLFEVDLAAYGNILFGAQFDPFLRAFSHPFTLATVQGNFDGLPALAEGSYRPRRCIDSAIADGRISTGSGMPDGGVPRRYTPTFASGPADPHDQCALLACARSSSVGLSVRDAWDRTYCCVEHRSKASDGVEADKLAIGSAALFARALKASKPAVVIPAAVDPEAVRAADATAALLIAEEESESKTKTKKKGGKKGGKK